MCVFVIKYRKITIISAGLILFRKPFLGGSFSGGGGAYYRDDICVKNQGGLFSGGGAYYRDFTVYV